MNKLLEIIKKYWFILFLGLLLRLTLSATTFHLDVRQEMIPSSSFLSGNFNIYQYAREISPGFSLDKLPLSYFLDLPIRLLFHFFIDTSKEKIFLLSPEKLFGDPWLFGYLIYAKLPLILADMLVGLFLVSIVEERRRKQILSIWMFNPITLWATTMIGQIDIYVALAVVISYILIFDKKYFWAALMLGIGGAIKSAPLLLLPFLLSMVTSWKQRLIILTLGALPTLLTILPYLNSVDFRRDALFAPQFSKMLYASLPLSGGESVIINVAIVLALYLWSFKKIRNASDFLKLSVSIFLLILSFTHFHLQWIVWILPLLCIWIVNNLKLDVKFALFLMFLGFVMMLFLFEASLQLRLFSPVFPILNNINGLWETLPNDKEFLFRSVSATIFASGAIYLSFRLLSHNSDE